MMEEAPTPSTDYRYKPWKARHRRTEGKVTFSETPTETYDIPLETEGTALTPATIKNVPIAGTMRAPMLQGRDPIMMIGSGVQGTAPRSGIEMDPRNPPQTETQLYLASQPYKKARKSSLIIPMKSPEIPRNPLKLSFVPFIFSFSLRKRQNGVGGRIHRDIL